jgi:hypothetical protein
MMNRAQRMMTRDERMMTMVNFSTRREIVNS